jgi:hypothetical protein
MDSATGQMENVGTSGARQSVKGTDEAAYWRRFFKVLSVAIHDFLLVLRTPERYGLATSTGSL